VATRELKKENATSMASKIREISISEFFSKNRHLLGFDSPLKALLTAVREGVDNALDACEEAQILPEIEVRISAVSENQFKVSISDNGPGIVKSHLPNIFGKLLYGSKFHRLKQSRGQQGIGISAAVMYGQMTTGKPAEVISKTGKGKPAHEIKLHIDTKKNAPTVIGDREINNAEWSERISGTCISMTLEGAYKEGRHGVLAYLSQTALSNPHANVTLIDPKGQVHKFPRLVNEVPITPKEIRPHPHGVELGTLIQMLHDAKNETAAHFLQHEFSRVTDAIAQEICEKAKIKPRQQAAKAGRQEAEALYKAIQDTKIMAPPTNCLSPMHEDSILKALYWLFVESSKWDLGDAEKVDVAPVSTPEPAGKKKGKTKQTEFSFEDETEAEAPKDSLAAVRALKGDEEGSVQSEHEGYFVTAITRPPSVYRGNPFQVEVGLFYGGGLKADALAQVYRYANRVPLQYQASACAVSKAVMSVPWKSYNLQQSKGALPTGPLVVMAHIASVWVPYTSESKEAIAHYPEILKELRLALMECGRRLQRYLSHKRRQADEAKKRGYIEKYLNPIGDALQEILHFSNNEKSQTIANLQAILEKTRDTVGPLKEEHHRPIADESGE